jgi:hypothetical protein
VNVTERDSKDTSSTNRERNAGRNESGACRTTQLVVSGARQHALLPALLSWFPCLTDLRLFDAVPIALECLQPCVRWCGSLTRLVYQGSPGPRADRFLFCIDPAAARGLFYFGAIDLEFDRRDVGTLARDMDMQVRLAAQSRPRGACLTVVKFRFPGCFAQSVTSASATFPTHSTSSVTESTSSSPFALSPAPSGVSSVSRGW